MEPFVTTTDVPTRAPVRPVAPIARASDDSCGDARARRRVATGGGRRRRRVRRREYVEVQARRAGTASWRAALPCAVAATAMLDGLEQHSGYAFRLVAITAPAGRRRQSHRPPLRHPRPARARACARRARPLRGVPATAAACQAGLEWSIFVNIDGAGVGRRRRQRRRLAAPRDGAAGLDVPCRAAPLRTRARRLRPVLRHWDGAALDGAAAEVAWRRCRARRGVGAPRFELAGTEWNHFVRADLEGELRDELAGEAPLSSRRTLARVRCTWCSTSAAVAAAAARRRRRPRCGCSRCSRRMRRGR